jgi:hypothetical protein
MDRHASRRRHVRHGARCLPPLLVIAALALAAGDAAAQENRAPAKLPGFVTDSRTGCRVWNNWPDAVDGVTWDGPCVQGLAQGQGTVQWFAGLVASTRYVGAMRGGMREGRGVTTFAEGRYEGQYVRDRQEGEGTYRSVNGFTYVGTFHDDRRHGHGTYVARDGTSYRGGWARGIRAGTGTMRYPNGASYDGQWLDNKPHGTGTYRSADGQVYSGHWALGCFQQGDRRAWLATSKASCGF